MVQILAQRPRKSLCSFILRISATVKFLKMINRAFFIFIISITFFSPALALAGDELIVGTIERPPFMFHSGDELNGFSVELWDQIATTIPVTYRWKTYQQFSELVSDTVNAQNNLAVANISITSEREKIADFSQPIFESGMAIAIKKGKGTSFLTLLWESGFLIFIVGAFATLLLIAHILWFFERNVVDARHDYFRDDYFGGIWDAFWWAFIIMTMGGFENEVPHKKISRFLAMIWIIVSLFFISTLTAKITTALTVAELQSGIESYKDLSGKRVGVTVDSSHQKFLESHGIRTHGYESLGQLYADLENEKLDAIVADLPILSYYSSHQGAGWLQITGEPFNLESFGILFPEKSDLVEEVNIALLQIRENGTYVKLLNKYFGEQ